MILALTIIAAIVVTCLGIVLFRAAANHIRETNELAEAGRNREAMARMHGRINGLRADINEDFDRLYERAIAHTRARQARGGGSSIFQNRTTVLLNDFNHAIDVANKKAERNRRRREARLLKKVKEGVEKDREEYKKKYGSSTVESNG